MKRPVRRCRSTSSFGNARYGDFGRHGRTPKTEVLKVMTLCVVAALPGKSRPIIVEPLVVPGKAPPVPCRERPTEPSTRPAPSTPKRPDREKAPA
jgi:hypothetical protein